MACCLATERGIEVCAPAHDPVMVCAPVERLEHDIEGIPEKIRNRQEHSIKVPMRWYEKPASPIPAGRCTVLVALHLLHLHWRSRGEPFKLPNGTLRYDGISHDSKTRALKDLEQRGLITVEWRERKSPIIHVHLTRRCVS